LAPMKPQPPVTIRFWKGIMILRMDSLRVRRA